jgi:hypothetical protein
MRKPVRGYLARALREKQIPHPLKGAGIRDDSRGGDGDGGRDGQFSLQPSTQFVRLSWQVMVSVCI